jgi:hypothetical protein
MALHKRVPKKLESLMNNKLLENKYKYVIKKDGKSGSFVDKEQFPPELGNYNFHYTHNNTIILFVFHKNKQIYLIEIFLKILILSHICIKAQLMKVDEWFC